VPGSDAYAYVREQIDVSERTKSESAQSTIVVTGASSGFGKLAATALARAGHTTYASMRDANGHNAEAVDEFTCVALAEGIDLRTVEMDVTSQESVHDAVRHIVKESGRIDVIVHNAGHMVFGPSEGFVPRQLLALYDVNVVGAQRVNRAVLPLLRAQGRGLLLWVSSSSVAGGTAPYLGPYFAAKAAMDSLAVTYALEVSRWGIETAIVVPGAFTSGTNHFAHASTPEDGAVAEAYEAGPYANFGDIISKAFAAIIPPDADAAAVADAIVDIVDTPFGHRPFRTYVDPSQDGSDVGFAVLDRLRAEMIRRIGLSDLFAPNEETLA
jgi:NAD(P)-dependent dehydrogenase (short-subunit alcohol dehydrogenase family)